LDHANRHLGLQLKRSDIRSVFAGLRPLIKGRKDETSDLSRSHDVSMSPSGLINVRGGKWTTYRKMAEDTLAFIRRKKRLDFSPADTRYSRIVEGPLPDRIHVPQGADELRTAVGKAVDEEMCATVEDFLARRFRTLFLDAKHAISLAPQVADLLAEAQGFSAEWAQQQTATFQQLAQGYLPKTS
jgi:glycerol-3-phosphate dehydrogenase